jgi:transcriptional regulator with XRE-family HTH domain
MTEPLIATVGDVIRKLRKDRRWSIRQLEHESGIGRMTISKLELNKTNFQHETLDAIAHAFGMTGADLEAMVSLPTLQRRSVEDLPAEWVAFTRRVMALNRHAHALFTALLLFCEEHRHHDSTQPEGHHRSGDGPNNLATHLAP